MQIRTFISYCLIAVLFVSCGETNNNENTKTEENTENQTTTEENKPKTEDDKIAEADALMQKIEADKAKYRVEKKRFMNTGKDMAHDQSIYTVYYDGDKMVKLIELMGESMYLAEAATYYKDGKIFMIHSAASYDDKLYDDTKIYFEEGKPFAAVGKSKEPEDETVDFSKLQITKRDLKAVITDMDAFMKGLAQTPVRLAASKPE